MLVGRVRLVIIPLTYDLMGILETDRIVLETGQIVLETGKILLETAFWTKTVLETLLETEQKQNN